MTHLRLHLPFALLLTGCLFTPSCGDPPLQAKKSPQTSSAQEAPATSEPNFALNVHWGPENESPEFTIELKNLDSGFVVYEGTHQIDTLQAEGSHQMQWHLAPGHYHHRVKWSNGVGGSGD